MLKKIKKLDPEIARRREQRKRKKLAKEIMELKKHSKKPRPVLELTLDFKLADTVEWGLFSLSF